MLRAYPVEPLVRACVLGEPDEHDGFPPVWSQSRDCFYMWTTTFCLAVKMLDGIPPERTFAAGRNLCRGFVDYALRTNRVVKRDEFTFDPPPAAPADPLNLAPRSMHVLAAVAAMAYHLRLTYHLACVDTHPATAPVPALPSFSAAAFGPGRRPAPPSAAPLAALMRPPPPFGPPDHHADRLGFPLCHVRATTAPAFFAHAAWVGYTFHRDGRHNLAPAAPPRRRGRARRPGPARPLRRRRRAPARRRPGRRPLARDRADGAAARAR